MKAVRGTDTRVKNLNTSEDLDLNPVLAGVKVRLENRTDDPSQALGF